MAFLRKKRGAWFVRVKDETGAWIERKTTARTKAEAWEIAETLERRAERVRLGLAQGVKEISVQQAYEKHFSPLRSGDPGFSAMDSRFRHHILPGIGKKFVHQVSSDDVLGLLAARARPWKRFNEKKQAWEDRPALSPQSREHIRVELSSFFTYVIDHLKAFAGPHPVRAVPKVGIPETPPKYLELEEITAALAVVPDRWRGFVATAVCTGLRFSELRRLRVREVDLERRMLTVWHTKNKKVRYVPVIEELVPYLKVELGRVRSEWLFPRPNGEMLTKDCGALRMFKRALRNAGIVDGYDHVCRTRGKKKGCRQKERRADTARSPCPKCGRLREVVGVPKRFAIKDLRSTAATHVGEQTGDLRIVQRMLGHQDITITEKKYAFAREKYLREQTGKVQMGLARREPAESDEAQRNAQKPAEVVRLRQAGKRP